MSRPLSSRIIFTGTLETTAPLHVGGVETGWDVDMLLATNGAGEYYIPGTSLAGALRAWFRRAFGCVLTEALFGPETETMHTDEGKSAEASRVYVEDAVIESDNVAPEVRDGVGIDRFSGAAAERIKYTRQVLPTGTRMTFRLEAELPPDKAEEHKARLALMIDALTKGRIAVGAAKTRGLGRMKLEDAWVSEQELSSREGILAFLKNGDSGKPFELSDFHTEGITVNDTAPLAIRVKWRPVLPIMVKADAAGIAVDMLPLFTGRNDGRLARVIPGSSIKGALRNMAERIMRTVLDDDIKEPADGRSGFLYQLEVKLVEELFGAPGKSKDDRGNEEAEDWQSGLGALAVADCHCRDHEITPGDWQALLNAEQARQMEGRHGMRHATRVAIDRWTGGAAERALYSLLEPHEGEWEELVLEVDPDRLPPEKDPRRAAALALLMLTLRELAQERIPLGFGTNRGLGAIEVERITIEAPDDLPLPAGTHELTPDDFRDAGKLAFLEDLQSAWQDWLAQARREEAA